MINIPHYNQRLVHLERVCSVRTGRAGAEAR